MSVSFLLGVEVLDQVSQDLAQISTYGLWLCVYMVSISLFVEICSQSWETWPTKDGSIFIFFSDRLLDFDRNATRRTEVVDDESDYYKGVDEAKVREQRHGSRLNKKFTLNLESGKISGF